MTGFLPAYLIDYSEAGFTNPHEVVLPDDPADCRDDFTHIGKKYWGFETGRHIAHTMHTAAQAYSFRHQAHHWMLVGLKKRAMVNRVSVSTKWYTGNQVRAVSVVLKDAMTGVETRVVERAPLAPDAEHIFDIPPVTATECLVECYQEGGIARVNFFGDAAEDQMPEEQNLLETATISYVSNSHYGTPAKAVQGARREMHMVGWESARTGFGERALFHLPQPAVLRRVVIDTYLHRLNPPLGAHIFALDNRAGADIDALMQQAPRWKIIFDDGTERIPEDFQSYMLNAAYLEEDGVKNRESFTVKLHMPKDCPWVPVLPFVPLKPDALHRLDVPQGIGAVTDILYMHYPNGGIHGLKVFGDVEGG